MARDANNELTIGMSTRPRYHCPELAVSQLTRCEICTLACRTLSAAEKLVVGLPQATALALDVNSPDLDTHVASHDVVISLVPFIYHADVIRSAIKGMTQVVTTSYVSPAMRELDAAAK
jgi:saccharopine dehydrogenase-like NADP-dependent oxidoreductase